MEVVGGKTSCHEGGFFRGVDPSQAKYKDKCALCEYTYKTIKSENCSNCPVFWGRLNTCHPLFNEWHKVRSKILSLSVEELKSRQEIAKKIRDLIKKALDKELENQEEVHHIQNDRIEMDIIRKGRNVKIKIHRQDERFRVKEMTEKDIIYEAKNNFYIKSYARPEVECNGLWLMGYMTPIESYWYFFVSFSEAKKWISRCKEAIDKWAKEWEGFEDDTSQPCKNEAQPEFKQLCCFWNKAFWGYKRLLAFFSEKLQFKEWCWCPFHGVYQNCEPYEGSWPEWAIEAYRKIEVLKHPEHQRLYERIRRIDDVAAERFRHYIVEWELWKFGQISESPMDISVTDKLSLCFVWDESNEGHNYWSEIYDKLKNED